MEFDRMSLLSLAVIGCGSCIRHLHDVWICKYTLWLMCVQCSHRLSRDNTMVVYLLMVLLLRLASKHASVRLWAHNYYIWRPKNRIILQDCSCSGGSALSLFYILITYENMKLPSQHFVVLYLSRSSTCLCWTTSTYLGWTQQPKIK